MKRWIAIASLCACAFSGCSKDTPQAAQPTAQAGTSESAAPEAGRGPAAGAPQTSDAPSGSAGTPARSAAGSGGAGSGTSAAGMGAAANGGSGGSSAAGTTASAGQGGAAMPAAPISIQVEADREHLYDDASKWLCLPGSKEELCTTGLDATIVRADGTTEAEPHVPAKDPAFDCFYVYPTVSNDPGSNADWNPGTEETDCVRAQAGRYSRVCRVFAPLYRQVTLTALNGNMIDDAARSLGYQDVIAAFNRYLTEYNKGRGFVLIGHSQGSGVLRKLMAAEIDARPELRDRLIAAHLLGTSVAVPEGQDVGGDFKNIPVCRHDDQTGCVLAYSTFRASSPPPSNSRFGKVASGRAVCANPAALGGGKATLIPYLKPSQVRGGPRVSTPFASYRDFLQAECVERDEFTYLQLTVQSGQGLPSDISGDITPDWGLHLVDVNIAMGSLVDLAAAEAAAYATKH
jgi:hypothetical protein